MVPVAGESFLQGRQGTLHLQPCEKSRDGNPGEGEPGQGHEMKSCREIAASQTGTQMVEGEIQ